MKKARKHCFRYNFLTSIGNFASNFPYPFSTPTKPHTPHEMFVLTENQSIQLKQAIFNDFVICADKKRTRTCSFLSFFQFQTGKRWEIICSQNCENTIFRLSVDILLFIPSPFEKSLKIKELNVGT